MTLTKIASTGVEDSLRWVLGANGTSDYTFTGPGLTGTVNDPTIYLTRGHTYIFQNNSGGHPFYIKTSIANGGTNDAYNTGVTNNGGGNGTEIVFTVPHDSPDILYYQCSSHASMAGQFNIAGSVADGSISTAKIADDAVNNDKLANSVVAAIAANTAKTSNATHTGDVTGSTALTIADDAVTSAKLAANAVDSNALGTNVVTTTKIAADAIVNSLIADNAVETANIADQQVTLAKLEHGTSSNDGKFLRANNGADPTFETVNTDLVSDTSPQLGGNLASNGNLIKFGDSSGASDDRLTFGNGDDIQVYYANSNLYVTQATGDIILENTGTNTSNQIYINGKANTNSIVVHGNGAVELYDQSSGSAVKRFETTSSGSSVTGTLSAGAGNIKVTDGGGFQAGNSNDLQIYHNGTHSFLDSATGSFYIRDGTTEKVRINGYGTAITGGLLFNSDTAAANALDDYEEGTFTPGLGRAGSNPSASFYGRMGRYVKIGKLVFCSVLVDAYNVSGGSGHWYCSNFPFNTYNDSNLGWVNTWVMGRLYFDGDYAMGVDGKSLRATYNSNTWYLYNQDDDTQVTANASRIIFQGNVTFMTN